MCCTQCKWVCESFWWCSCSSLCMVYESVYHKNEIVLNTIYNTTEYVHVWARGSEVNVLFKRIKKFSISMNLHIHAERDSKTDVIRSHAKLKHVVVYGLNYNICVSICVVNVFCFNAVVVSVVLLLLLTEYYHVHCLEIEERNSFITKTSIFGV